MLSRLNLVGAAGLVALLIGAIWYATEDSDEREDGILAFLWIAVALLGVQYMHNLFAYGEPAMGKSVRDAAAPASAAAGASGAEDEAMAAKIAELTAENARLRNRSAAAGADEKAGEKAAADLALANTRVAALKDEIAASEARNVEREVAFKENIGTLQAEIGRLNGDSDERNQVVAGAQEQMKGLKPYIGIMIEDLPKKQRREQPGVRIQTVKPDTPAEGAGFQKGDIIERMNSKDMTTSEDVMSNLVQRKPGDICSFIVRRGGEMVNVVMEVGHKELDKAEVHRIRRLASGLIHADDLETATEAGDDV